MPKTLMFLQSAFPPDVRLEKEIKSLTQNGIAVIVLCNQYVKNLNPTFSNSKIVRIKALFKNLKLNKILNFPLFLNPRFIYYTLKTYLREKPDILHAHDLPMVPLALMLKRIFKKKVIYDMHENYPEALISFDKRGLLNKIFKNPKLAQKLDNYCQKKVDKIIVVVEENKQHLVKKGIEAKKIEVVSNTIDTNDQLGLSTSEKIKEFENKFVILYSGNVSAARGLDTPIKAMKNIIKEIPNAYMVILGEGDFVPTLKKLSQSLNLEKYVGFIKWPGHDKLYPYLNNANILMIPQPSNDYINTTIPHKLFEYMYVGKPIIVSDALPLKRIITETNAGVYFISNNPNDFAEKINILKTGKIDFCKNGPKAVNEKYNWLTDSKNLLKIYHELQSISS